MSADKREPEEIVFPNTKSKTPMDRLLESLVREFPGYTFDKSQMAQAGYAIGTLAGSVAAWVMANSSDPDESLRKFLRLVETVARDMAGKGYPLVKARMGEMERKR